MCVNKRQKLRYSFICVCTLSFSPLAWWTHFLLVPPSSSLWQDCGCGRSEVRASEMDPLLWKRHFPHLPGLPQRVRPGSGGEGDHSKRTCAITNCSRKWTNQQQQQRLEFISHLCASVQPMLLEKCTFVSVCSVDLDYFYFYIKRISHFNCLCYIYSLCCIFRPPC